MFSLITQVSQQNVGILAKIFNLLMKSSNASEKNPNSTNIFNSLQLVEKNLKTTLPIAKYLIYILKVLLKSNQGK